jgi:hypothetical protein
MHLHYSAVLLGGLVVIVLAIGSKVHNYSAEDDGFLRAIKTHSMTSFQGKVKPMVPCHKILRHVRNPYSMKEIPVGKIHGHFSPSFILWIYSTVFILDFVIPS